MYSDFFKYLAEKLNEYFEKTLWRNGEVYFIQLDEREMIKLLYEQIGDLSNAKKYIDTSFNKEFEMCELMYEGKSIYIASSIYANDGNLVLLRNAIKEQKENYYGKSILFLINNYDLESITNDGADLLDKGMPFNPNELAQGLNKTLENSNMQDVEKLVISFNINRKQVDAYEEMSLFEYANDFALMKKGIIEDDDYVKLGLFKDKNMCSSGNINERLEQNSKLFEKVQRAHDLNLEYEKLSEDFDDGGVGILSSGKWASVDFGTVNNSFNNNKKNKSISLEKIVIKDMDYYEKNKSQSTAGKRNKSIIIFNPNLNDRISIKLEFDNKAPIKFLQNVNGITAKGDGTMIKLELEAGAKVIYYQIKYSYEKKSATTFKFDICILPMAAEILQIEKNQWVNANKKLINLSVKDEDSIIMGDAPTTENVREVKENQMLDLNDYTYRIEASVIEELDRDIDFFIRMSSYKIACKLINDGQSPTPISINAIEQYKRDSEESFIKSGKTITIAGTPYYFGEDKRITGNIDKVSDRLFFESQIIENDIVYGYYENGNIYKEALSFDADIEKSYLEILDYYKKHETTPLLSYFDEEQSQLYEKFIAIFFSKMSELNDCILNEEQKSMLMIGSIKYNDEYWFTPFNIINILYKYAFEKQLKKDKVSKAILERLDASAIVPYLYFSNEVNLYRCISSVGTGNWLKYINNKKASLSVVDKYLERIVFSKLD
ncbi:MAG: hypothetical protein R3Y47_01180 [Lachnospiraceae bacterium]